MSAEGIRLQGSTKKHYNMLALWSLIIFDDDG